MRPTICSGCKHSNGGIFTVCPICKTEQATYTKVRERSRSGPRNRHPVFRLARREGVK